MQLFAIGAGVCVMFKEAIEWLLSNILPWISYVVGPVIAVVSFYFNRLDRRELMAQAEALGKLKEEVRQSERRLSEKDRELSTAVAKNEDRSREIDKLEDNLRQVTTGASTLWKLKPNRPFDRYKEWMHDPKGARILTIGNLKGGVGKTTLAANLAAYISEERRLPVLLVDLDYQGSLSSLALLAAGKTEAESPINQLFDPNATLATLIKNEIHLAPKLTQGWLIGANYTLAQQENELLFKWVMESDSVIDVRYRLAHLFLNPDVRRKYAAIIFDMPPRLTMAPLNALLASHYFVVPTVLDKLSGEAVAQFLTVMKSLKDEMQLSIDLAGIAGMMTRTDAMSGIEPAIFESLLDTGQIWRDDVDFRLARTMPRRVAVAQVAGEDFAWLLPAGQGGNDFRSVFRPLVEEICARVKLDEWR